jgi:hypothetical protein
LAKAYTNFTKTIERSRQVIALYRADVDLAEKEDLVRFSVVLTVAALDSYFTDKFCDVLVPFLKKNEPTNDLIEILENAGLNAKTALELISMDRPFRRIRTLVERSFSNYTTQRTDVIDKLFRSIGLQDFSNNAQRIVGRKSLKKRVQMLVNRRNDIAHESDLDYRGRPKKIDVEKIEGQIADLELFVEGAEKLIKNRLSSK